MEEKLIELLEGFGYPVYLQGSLAADEPYPETFITYWNGSTDGSGYYDNGNTQAVYSYDVNVYSEDPDAVYSLPRKIAEALKAAGWITPPDGYSVASDEATHRGRGMTVTYLGQN